MIFFKNEINVSNVFNIEDNDTEVIKRIKEIGEWSNPPEPVSYSDKIALYSYLYAYDNGLRDFDLTGFTSIISGLLTDMSASFGFPRKIDMEIEDKAIEFLNTLNIADPEMEDNKKAIALILFVSTLYLQKEKDSFVKKSVVLTKRQIEKIEQIEGNKFSDKLRTVIDLFFHEK